MLPAKLCPRARCNRARQYRRDRFPYGARNCRYRSSGTFNLDSIQLFVFHGDEIILADGISFDLVLGIDDLFGAWVDELALHPIARFFIDGVEPNPCGHACRRVKGDGAGDQRQFEITLLVAQINQFERN
jgi:hypothetical protein